MINRGSRLNESNFIATTRFGKILPSDINEADFYYDWSLTAHINRLHIPLQPTPQQTITTILIQHPTQPLRELIYILHTMHSSTRFDPTTHTHYAQASSQTLTVFRLLSHTINTSTAHDTLTHPQPSSKNHHDQCER